MTSAVGANALLAGGDQFLLMHGVAEAGTHACAEAFSGDGEQRHGRKDDKGEFPAVNEGFDHGEDVEEHEEHNHE